MEDPDVTRVHMENYRWRFCIPVTATFILLSFIVVYDRSYLDSAILVVDQQFKTLYNTCTTADTSRPSVAAPTSCNIFDGKWVYDDSYPLYSSCHLAEKNFRCHDNGRLDTNYQKWRWQPHGCRLPRFDADDMLARLEGLRVVIVGDSMGRTQWESLSCLLLQAVKNKSSVEMIGGPITRQKPHLGTRFHDHNVSLDYYRSPFLVEEGSDVPKRSPARVLSTIKLKKIDMAVARNFLDADVLLINTGHWWTSTKTYDSGCYFEEDRKLMLGLSVMNAYQKAMSTITSWVNDHVDFSRTEVFFRSYEPSHPGLVMASQPYSTLYNIKDYPRARILKEAVGVMGKPATVLNITSLSAYRPDGHLFKWGVYEMVDRAHWCLPGVPDTWNELLYASLLARGRGVWATKSS